VLWAWITAKLGWEGNVIKAMLHEEYLVKVKCDHGY
jgi:hypothetical protein